MRAHLLFRSERSLHKAFRPGFDLFHQVGDLRLAFIAHARSPSMTPSVFEGTVLVELLLAFETKNR